MLKQLRAEIHKLADPKKAKILQGFSKTGKGEYAEGDIFLGIVMPKQRALAKKYWDKITLPELDILIKSKIHEERLIALLILVKQFESFTKNSIRSNSDKIRKFGSAKIIFKFYLSHTKHINNWDLVDLSAPNIVGEYLYSLSLDGRGAGVRVKNKTLHKLALSKNLWEKRIAILATFAFIKQGECQDALKIAKMLMDDKHDLIHKAVGWMLREVGKRVSEKTLTDFLDKNVTIMPRTMLRYSIERLPIKTKKYFLNK